MSHYLNPEPSAAPLQERSSGGNSCETMDENFYEEFSPRAAQSSGKIAQTVNQQFPDRYQCPGTVSVNSSQQPPGKILSTTNSTAYIKSDWLSCKWKAITLTALLLAVISVGFSILLFFREQITKKETLVESNKIRIINNMDEFWVKKDSCQGLRSLGYSASGFYDVVLGPKQQRVTVFCDMESDGGGWTLVASMNDKSFHDQCSNNRSWIGGRNWESSLVFGKVENIPAEEYKNAAFFYQKATDVMAWHVPHQSTMKTIEKQAFLKYHTSNHFLKNHQSNLKFLFNSPLNLPSATGLVETISASATRIRSSVSNWHNYTYDGKVKDLSIKDGGADMYDIGNKISFYVNGDATRVRYEASYHSVDLGYSVTSLAIHPFTMVASISNSHDKIRKFTIQVESDLGADGRGSYTSHAGSYTHGGISIKYKYYQVYGASNDPSVCEVYFAITNSEWKSFSNVSLVEKWTNATDFTRNTVTFRNMRNVLIGYLLLSRVAGQEVTYDEVRSVMKAVTTIAGNTPLPHNIAVPVTFLKGSPAEISRSLTPEQIGSVQSGYLEFKAVDPDEQVYALCPGVRVLGARGFSANCLGDLSNMSSVACSADSNTNQPANATWLRNQTSVLLFIRNGSN